MYESSFSIHEIEFMINSREYFSNSSRVRDHAYSSHNFSEITTWDTSWAPVDELDSSFGFDSSNRSVYIFWYNIPSVHHTTGHIFTVSWITFSHHRGRFESGVSDFSNGELFMISFFSRDNWSISKNPFHAFILCSSYL